MNILIIGLGLMGGSYAMGLKKKGHTIYAVDKNLESIKYALDNNLIDSGSDNPLDFINKSELIIIGLYPKLILNFLNEYQNEFKENQLITDLCGVKMSFLPEAQKLSGKAEYLSHHPMAGKEKSGVIYSNIEMFEKANFLICPTDENKESSIDIIKKIGMDLNFGNISVIDPNKHDEMIAYTSQLTHAIAVSLVNSDTSSDTKDYVGDSYRDLTRIAKINEDLWSDLFFSNKEKLLNKIIDFEQSLNVLKKALVTNDTEGLKELFKKSTKHRKEME